MKSEEERTLYNKNIAIHVSNVSIVVNVALSIFKILIGIVASSAAMISDGIHSASDVFSTIIVIIGVTIAGKKSDDRHPYGHERFESIASIILCLMLGLTGIGIGYKGILTVINMESNPIEIPKFIALIAAVISIIVKAWMFIYTKNAANKVNSSALRADAYHHLSDSLSSIGAFIGILGARLGLRVLDPVASIVIAVFILKASFDICRDAVNRLVDTSCDKDTEDYIKDIAKGVDGVVDVDYIRTRLFGSRVYVDIEISADGNKSLNETHEIAETVHNLVEQKLSVVKHCMVHVNPSIEKEIEKCSFIHEQKSIDSDNEKK